MPKFGYNEWVRIRSPNLGTFNIFRQSLENPFFASFLLDRFPMLEVADNYDPSRQNDPTRLQQWGKLVEQFSKEAKGLSECPCFESVWLSAIACYKIVNVCAIDQLRDGVADRAGG
jgi:hypothetical protein